MKCIIQMREKGRRHKRWNRSRYDSYCDSYDAKKMLIRTLNAEAVLLEYRLAVRVPCGRRVL